MIEFLIDFACYGTAFGLIGYFVWYNQKRHEEINLQKIDKPKIKFNGMIWICRSPKGWVEGSGLTAEKAYYDWQRLCAYDFLCPNQMAHP